MWMQMWMAKVNANANVNVNGNSRREGKPNTLGQFSFVFTVYDAANSSETLADTLSLSLTLSSCVLCGVYVRVCTSECAACGVKAPLGFGFGCVVTHRRIQHQLMPLRAPSLAASPQPQHWHRWASL